MKLEEGYMVVKDSMAWGTVYDDRQCAVYGWVSIEDAKLSKSELPSPTWFTYPGSPDEASLLQGKVVKVIRRTEVIIQE